MTNPAYERGDQATRLLASAVHLDDDLADAVVAEFLTERYRAVPPSPGVRAEVVLREAVTARARRRTINAALVAGLFSMALVALPVLGFWWVSGFSWRVCSAVVTRLSASRALTRFGITLSGPIQRWWVTAAIWSASSVLWLIAFAPLAVFAAVLADATPPMLWIVGAAVLTPLLYTVLVAAEYLPWTTALNWYSLPNYNPAAPVRDQVAKACARYADRLRLIAEDDLRRLGTASDEVIVYRGEDPFVGAGIRVRSWSATFELCHEHSKPKAPLQVPEFRPVELQEFVATEMAQLRKARNLTPGWRFTDLEISRWAMISGAQLPYAPGLDIVMAQLRGGMPLRLPEPAWNELGDCSPEWLRYFACYRIEGWARQLAVAGYLHVGCEENTLVLEWHSFVLPPVAPGFRRVDAPPAMLELRAAWKALADLALLPTTLPSRLADVVRGLREGSPPEGGWQTPEQAARTFGAAASVRELAASTRYGNFFMGSDSDRYQKILERRVLGSVRQFLGQRGIVARGFEEMVTQINNSTVVSNSNVIAGTIGGEGNTGAVGSDKAGSGRTAGSGN